MDVNKKLLIVRILTVSLVLTTICCPFVNMHFISVSYDFQKKASNLKKGIPGDASLDCSTAKEC